MSVMPRLGILFMLIALIFQTVSGFDSNSGEFTNDSEDEEEGNLSDNIFSSKSQSQEAEYETNHFASSSGVSESASSEEFLIPTFPNVYSSQTSSTAGCKRHKWIPMHSMKPQDVLNLPHFHYNGADKLPLHPCRVKTKSGMRIGMYNQLKQECLITYGPNEQRLKSDVEILTIPGGLNLQTGIYKVEPISCNKMLKTAVVAYNPSDNRMPYIGYMKSGNGVGSIGEVFGQRDRLSVGTFVVRGKTTQVEHFSVLTCVECTVFATTPRTTTARPTKSTKLPTRIPITTRPTKRTRTVKPRTKPTERKYAKTKPCIQAVKVKTTCIGKRCETIVVDIELVLDHTKNKKKKQKKKKSYDDEDNSNINASLSESTQENSDEEVNEHDEVDEANTFESDDGSNSENDFEADAGENHQSNEGHNLESTESEVNVSDNEADLSTHEFEETSGSIESKSDKEDRSEESKDSKTYKIKKGTCFIDFNGELTIIDSETENEEDNSSENYQVGDVVESYYLGSTKETEEVSTGEETSNESRGQNRDDVTSSGSRGSESAEEEKSSENTAQHRLEYNIPDEKSESHEVKNESDGHNGSNYSSRNSDSGE